MNKNRKDFMISITSCGIIFLIGLLYLLLPIYYGLDAAVTINVNVLFIILMLILASTHFFEFILLEKSASNENIFLSIAFAATGLLNILLNTFVKAEPRLMESLIAMLVLYSGIKIYTICCYKDNKDAYQYIEEILLIPVILIGMVVTILTKTDTITTIISLGFYTIIMCIIKTIGVSLKAMLKSKRFIKKIKLK